MAGIIVAIDGPSGSGKSTTAKTLAKRANWSYLDTGALYRAATWLALKNNLEQPFEIIAALKTEPITFNTNPDEPTIHCGDVDITTEIRSLRVTDQVSIYSQMKELREQRSQRAARHDDRSFGAKRTARTDGDRRRKRFQKGNLEFYAALSDQNRLNRFGDSVAADFL